MGFILLNKRKKLMILVLINFIVKGIGGYIVHIALSISICKTKSFYINGGRI